MDYLRFILALIIVLGLILLLGALFRKFMMSGSLFNGAFLMKKRTATVRQQIEIKESRILDAKRRLMVLSYNNHDYLLMLTNHGDMLLDKVAQNNDDAHEASEQDLVKAGEKDASKDASLINQTKGKKKLGKRLGQKRSFSETLKNS
ncbi:MAG: flagellar biosynthetic protein FliO [Alphaproteobacteria bacterium]|nr:flagellar biosynthetic protein FliO [Alphaproteobacteria bacterium]